MTYNDFFLARGLSYTESPPFPRVPSPEGSDASPCNLECLCCWNMEHRGYQIFMWRSHKSEEDFWACSECKLRPSFFSSHWTCSINLSVNHTDFNSPELRFTNQNRHEAAQREGEPRWTDEFEDALQLLLLHLCYCKGFILLPGGTCLMILSDQSDGMLPLFIYTLYILVPVWDPQFTKPALVLMPATSLTLYHLEAHTFYTTLDPQALNLFILRPELPHSEAQKLLHQASETHQLICIKSAILKIWGHKLLILPFSIPQTPPSARFRLLHHCVYSRHPDDHKFLLLQNLQKLKFQSFKAHKLLLILSSGLKILLQ